jgi:YidC/Oxa1 family membrane protein insertase
LELNVFYDANLFVKAGLIQLSDLKFKQMSDNKNSVQSRFLLAVTLSMLVLLAWGYFFPAQKKEIVDNNNTNVASNVAPIVAITPAVTQTQTITDTTPDNTPNKLITIKTPLYQVKLDSKGGLATSWILFKNVRKPGDEQILYADGSSENSKTPLELISPEGLAKTPREIPFRLITGDANFDNLVNDRNYSVDATDIELSGSESKTLNFLLKDGDLEVTKTFTFRADTNISDLQVKATRGGQTIPNVKLLIGAAIGDQGIKHHNYYHIESEGVAFVNNTVDRHVANSFLGDTKIEGSLSVLGEVDWAGVGDSYFAMAAIPATKNQGLEYKVFTQKKTTEPFYDGIIAWVTRSQTTEVTRHLVSAHVPIVADGSTNKVYTGSKDYFTLANYDASLTSEIGRSVSLGDLVNFSWYSWFRWIIKPISIKLLQALNFIYSFTGNYGVAIIIFTLLFYSLFFPIRLFQSKAFKKSQKSAPKMKEIQDKQKELTSKGVAMDDPRMRELQMEQMKMMKDTIPIAGCLPLLLQMPLFIALYTAVTIGLDFRQATFLWLPDLAAGDPWHILEFLFAASMAGSMIFTPTTPAVTDEQKMQQKMMTYMMPVMMLWVMWGASAGLLLYWFFGNIVSFGQQFIINRMNKTDDTTPPVIDITPKKIGKLKTA